MEPFNNFSKKRHGAFLDKLEKTVAYVKEHYPLGTQINWKKVQELISKRFPNRNYSIEALRNRYRRLKNINNVNIITKRKDDYVAGRMTLEQRLLNEVKKKRPLEWLVQRLGESEENIMAAVTKLQLQGYRGVTIFDEDGVVFIHNRVRSNQSVPYTGNRPVYTISETFAVVSDTHIGSIQADLRALSRFYDEVEKRGIDTVLHAGDVVDGYYPNRPTSIMEQSEIGFTNQLKKVVKDYPKREGITTFFITGNHDYTYLRHGFANIGETLDSMRKDMVYLGHNYGKFWLTEDVSISLIHPVDGISRNFNNKIRDIVERRPEQRSDLMFVGHYHKVASLKHQGTYAYVVPSFQRQTAFMADNGLESVVAGMFVTVNLNELGEIAGVTTEIMEF